ncbi:MAG TPA: Na+/H+ antiporter subunit E [Solirubrobacteraceae bacterium]|jgi:multisubunit Na+/H+ antiporter MnhE subunit
MNAQADKRRRPLVGVLMVIGWWGLLGGMWMLLVDTVSTAEVLCAIAAALAGVLVTRLVFDSGIASMRPAGSLPRALAKQLVRVPADLWLLAVALARALAGRPRPGRFYELAIELPVSARGNGQRAAIELLGSLAPNTIVLGVDEQRVIVHQLLARHPERESVVEVGS